MTIRYYYSQIIGDGLTLETSFRPALVDLLPPIDSSIFEGRANPQVAGGWSLVLADVTNQQNNIVRADARVLPLPFEEGGSGRVLGLDENTGVMAQVDIDRVVSRSENLGIPLHDFNGKSVRQVLRRIMKRLILRGIMGNVDFTEGLNTTWGSLSAARRTNIRNRLIAVGVDPTPINGPDTIRIAIHKILDQEIPSLKIAI